MTDEVDFASAIEAAERVERIYQARARLAGEGSAVCDDCGHGIKAARRLAMPSARTCAPCQAGREAA